jgi:hypothetical protein
LCWRSPAILGETRMRLRLPWLHSSPRLGVGTPRLFQSSITDRTDSPASTRSAASLILAASAATTAL